MSTHDDQPVELEDIERQLRRALTLEAHRMTPTDRLDDILGAARQSGSTAPGGGPRRWLAPVAAAAAVALIAAGAWAVTQRTGDQLVPTPPASSGPSAPSATSAPTPSASASSAPPAATTSVAVPVYFVGSTGSKKPTLKLFREFRATAVPAHPTDSQKAKAALTLAIQAQPTGNPDGYVQVWSGQRVDHVTVTPTAITVALASSGPSGEDAATQRLAVQQLVWTAQAAVGKGPIPVRFTVADGSSALFGRFPTSASYNRPGPDLLYQDLAPVWVTSPTRDQVYASSTPVVVQGQAIVFEGTVAWSLTRGSATVRSGSAMASVGAPAQGSYAIPLGTLSPGAYTVRVWETSMADGSVAAQRSVTFTVR